MALIKNVERTLTINTGYGLSDLLTYMSSGATASTTEITVMTQGVGTPDPTYLWMPGASSGGSFYTGRTVSLQTTINSTALIIEVISGSLATWPGSGYIYFTSPAEGIYYSSINPSTTSASGNDEFVIASVADRGWSGSASTHTAVVTIHEIAVWYVQSINYDTSSGLFNFSYFAREASRVGYQAPDIPGNVYSQDRSFSGSLFNAYELVEESAT
tara:strand:- start:3971 stop:4615 length:645 start_codon:yes stop_codon:yes gene_type:complete